jgi:hypothetical protein
MCGISRITRISGRISKAFKVRWNTKLKIIKNHVVDESDFTKWTTLSRYHSGHLDFVFMSGHPAVFSRAPTNIS